jgi:hypothetical protein
VCRKTHGETEHKAGRNLNPQRLIQSILQVRKQKLNVLPSITVIFKKMKRSGFLTTSFMSRPIVASKVGKTCIPPQKREAQWIGQNGAYYWTTLA